MIRILLDSSADFSAEEAKERNMELVPINITMNGKNYLDGVDITKDEFYDLLVSSEEFPMTAQPSPQDYIDIFEDAKEKGDSLVYFSLSSGSISGWESNIDKYATMDVNGVFKSCARNNTRSFFFFSPS